MVRRIELNSAIDSIYFRRPGRGAVADLGLGDNTINHAALDVMMDSYMSLCYMKVANAPWGAREGYCVKNIRLQGLCHHYY